MKLPNGYGAVVKLAGRRRKPYAARITVGWTEDGKQIRKYLGYYKTRQEAIKALADYNENPFDLMEKDVTFADVYQRWANLKFKDKPGSRISILRHWDAKLAIDQELVKINFAVLVKLPPAEQSQIHKPFTPAELDTLWQNVYDIGAQIALILCYSGLRPTELIQIKTANVDLANRYMRGGIKTAAGKNRIIPIAKKIQPLIEKLYNPDAEYLVVSPRDNKPVLTYSRLVSHFWKNSPVLKSLPTKHLPHDGRHTCATLMDNAEVPLKIQQLILGHSSHNITSRVYTRTKISSPSRHFLYAILDSTAPEVC